jgi:sarcosine oxidase gamma subunit
VIGSVADVYNSYRQRGSFAITRATLAAEQMLGIVWPKSMGAVVSGRANILCIGPTDWLVMAADPHPAALLRMLSEAVEGSAFSRDPCVFSPDPLPSRRTQRTRADRQSLCAAS